MASFKSSHLPVISGIRCFAAWADEHRPGTPHLPASNDDLRLWSSYFQNGGTFSNYVTNLKTAHTLRGMKVDWDEELLRRLRAGAKKLNVHMIKAAIKFPVKKEMVTLATRMASMKTQPSGASRTTASSGSPTSSSHWKRGRRSLRTP